MLHSVQRSDHCRALPFIRKTRLPAFDFGSGRNGYILYLQILQQIKNIDHHKVRDIRFGLDDDRFVRTLLHLHLYVAPHFLQCHRGLIHHMLPFPKDLDVNGFLGLYIKLGGVIFG